MKAILYIISLTIGILLLSFKSSYTSQITSPIQTKDSIPELNKGIIEFAKSKLKKKVGTGECWDLAAEALKSVDAKWDMKYKFGKEINYKKEPVYAGDIIQFSNVVLNYKMEKRNFTEKFGHHTAIIYEVTDQNNFVLIHQNTSYTGRKVGTSPLDIRTLTKGKFKIYRAEK